MNRFSNSYRNKTCDIISLLDNEYSDEKSYKQIQNLISKGLLVNYLNTKFYYEPDSSNENTAPNEGLGYKLNIMQLALIRNQFKTLDLILDCYTNNLAEKFERKWKISDLIIRRLSFKTDQEFYFQSRFVRNYYPKRIRNKPYKVIHIIKDKIVFEIITDKYIDLPIELMN